MKKILTTLLFFSIFFLTLCAESNYEWDEDDDFDPSRSEEHESLWEEEVIERRSHISKHSTTITIVDEAPNDLSFQKREPDIPHVLPTPLTAEEEGLGLAKLKDTCWDSKDKEERYLFRLCLFQNVTRHTLRFHTRPALLGTWGQWAGSRKMLYNSGDTCSDQKMTTKVELVCPKHPEDVAQSHHKLIHVEEVGFCEFSMRFRTSLACEIPEAVKTENELENAVVEQFVEFVLPGLEEYGKNAWHAAFVLANLTQLSRNID